MPRQRPGEAAGNGRLARPWRFQHAGDHGAAVAAVSRPGRGWLGPGISAHTGQVGRNIGTIAGVILAIWVAFMALGGIFAMVKTFLIIGLIAVAVFIVVWLVAGRRRGVG
jgi:hypothetical protein